VRWRLALYGMAMLLTDLGLDLSTRRAVLGRIREAYAKEFRADANLRHQLGARYRQERQDLDALLDPTRGAGGLLAPGLTVLRRRSERLAPVVAELKACAQAGELTLALAAVAPSYLHMHANRLLRSAQRAQELVLYEFLGRLYESQAARG
jgi:thiopeptide-type bacteriocin biosynthesis protein